MKDRRKNSRALSVLIFCLISAIQVACDSSQKENQVEQGFQPDQSTIDDKIESDKVKQSRESAPIPQEIKSIAPGNIVVLALSSYDKRAVVKTAQGELQTLKIGNVVQGTDATLIDILDDRLVFDEITTKPSGLKVKNSVWVYKAKDGVSRVQALNQQPPKLKEYSVNKIYPMNKASTMNKALVEIK